MAGEIRAGRKPVPPHLRGKRARARVVREQQEALARNDLRTWRRSTAVRRCLDGASIAQIVTELKCTDSAVTKWLSAYVTRGFAALTPAWSPGPAMRLSPEQQKSLARAVEAGPEAAGFACGVWTARLVAEYIRQQFGVEYNWKYVPELLHKLGFSVQRPRKRLSRADHSAQEFWLRETLPRIKKKPPPAAE